MVVLLAGMIGLGKSTVSALIAEHLNAEVVYESVDDNRVLELFYQDQRRWAFTLQTLFLSTRYRAITNALRHRHKVLDRSVYEDEIFARLNYEDGNMTEAELDTYLALLHDLMDGVNAAGRPDLMVYLTGSFDTVMNRIHKRGREYEQAPELTAYYHKLWTRYPAWIQAYDASPTLVIDMDRYDVQRQADAAAILALVDKTLATLTSQQ